MLNGFLWPTSEIFRSLSALGRHNSGYARESSNLSDPNLRFSQEHSPGINRTPQSRSGSLNNMIRPAAVTVPKLIPSLLHHAGQQINNKQY